MNHRTAGRALAGLLALTVAIAPLAQTTTTTTSTSPAKKELVQRILRLQQAEIEGLARALVERPAAQMMQEAGLAIQRQVAPEKREAIGKQIEVEVRKYVDDAYPVVRDRALKLAPTTFGAALETKMSEDELKTLLAWLESAANKKYQQIAVEARNGFVQQVMAEAGPAVQPKLQALDARVRVILGVPPASAAPAATPPARPASR
ncbi:MAG TPA: hypothetical protein VH041_13805 [Caldimonas sp.]|jgi:hypothetical protein|nr:hypothetical protein [Caldimonas sp.]HEX4235366.1 hypothetical protein [Caldimonas sp.]